MCLDSGLDWTPCTAGRRGCWSRGSVGGTRKFHNTHVYNPSVHALGHLGVAFADYPATGSPAGWEGQIVVQEAGDAGAWRGEGGSGRTGVL